MRHEVQRIVHDWIIGVLTHNRASICGNAAHVLQSERNGHGAGDIPQLVDQEIDAIALLLKSREDKKGGK